MERASGPATPSVPAFRDGLGERRPIVDPSGNALEQLCLRSELSAVPSFEFALRERVSRLAGFRHEQFARVRGVERLSDPESVLCVVSERVNGVRLSELLKGAEQRRLGLDTTAALYLIRQLVTGVADLHESAREVAHGVIGPERLVVTPDGRLVIVEYVLGAALEQLRYPRERYWSELRVALPSSAGLARLDQRADVTQVGIVALSLILGRLLRKDEYSARIAEVLASAQAVAPGGGTVPLPSGLRTWIGRALQLDVRTGFSSTTEARAELDKVLADVGDLAASPANLEAFLARYHGLPPPQLLARTPVVEPISRPAPAALQTPVKPATPVVTIPPPKAPATPTTLRNARVAISTGDPTPPLGTLMPPSSAARAMTPALGMPVPSFARAATPTVVNAPMRSLTPARGTPIPALRPPVATPPLAALPPIPIPPTVAVPRLPAAPLQLQAMAESVTVTVPTTPPRGIPIPSSARHPATPPRPPTYEPPPPVSVIADREVEEATNWPKLAAIAGAFVALLLVVAFTGWTYFKPVPVAATDGTLVITTNPSSAQAFVDGRLRGVTPVTLQLPAGGHRLELRSPGGSRTIRIMIIAGKGVSQYIELPQGSGVGHIQITTEPSGARVTVDGVARGTSPVTVSQLAPGDHAVLLESNLGFVKRTVTVESGATAQLTAAMASPEAASAPGWFAVTSPLELQLFEGDRLLGTSRNDRIMVPAGRHDIDLVNEAYGYRDTRTVQVAAGKLITLATEMPKGTLALNATPWAEVWIEGTRIGETPIGGHSLSIGAHEVVFRHPELGEQTATANVTLKDVARLSVDMTRK